MSLGEAKDFIAEKVEAVKAESQPPAAGDDAEDLVSCAINYRNEVDKSFLFFFILGKSLSIHKSSWNEFSFKALLLFAMRQYYSAVKYVCIKSLVKKEDFLSAEAVF